MKWKLRLDCSTERDNLVANDLLGFGGVLSFHDGIADYRGAEPSCQPVIEAHGSTWAQLFRFVTEIGAAETNHPLPEQMTAKQIREIGRKASK